MNFKGLIEDVGVNLEMTAKRFEETYGEMGLFRVKDNKTGKCYKAVLCGNPFTETDEPILDVLNEIAEENEQLKKALWCIRKRYGYTIEEFVEDLKDNGTDLSKVDLK